MNTSVKMTRPTYSDEAAFPITVGVPLKIANECGTRSRKMIIRSAKDSVPEPLIQWMSTHKRYAHMFVEAAPEEPDAPDDLTKLSGVGEGVQDNLRAAGYLTYESIARAKFDDLVNVNGVSSNKAQSAIIESRTLAGMTEE